MSERNFWTNQSVLVTGLTGFIGCWLAERLLALGARVVGYDLDLAHALGLHPGLAERVTLIRGDILDTSALAAAFREHKIGVCFHLAGQSMIETGLASPAKTFEINVRGTWSVLEAAKAAGVERIIVSSSNTVYGPQARYPFSEDAALNGEHPYAASKACCDILTRSYAKTLNLHAVACRQTNTFGGADPHATHIVPASILALLAGEPPLIKSDGTPSKSYLYVEDTVEGYLRLAEMASDPRVSGQAFNITAEPPVSVLELVRTIITVSGSGAQPHVLGTAETTRKEHEHLSPAAARSVLGWSPRHSLAEGLTKTIGWYRLNLGLYHSVVKQYGHHIPSPASRPA